MLLIHLFGVNVRKAVLKKYTVIIVMYLFGEPLNVSLYFTSFEKRDCKENCL